MVLESQRDLSDRYLRPYALKLKDYDPNTLTWIAFGISLLSALFFILTWYHFIFLFFASLFIFLSGLLDLLDGMVARITNRTSNLGDFLDHALDRYADFFILLGISFSPFANIYLGLFAIIAMFLASYMGTQAQAVGSKRLYRGYLSRADRLTILIFAPIIQMVIVIVSIYILRADYIHYIFTIFSINLSLTFFDFVLLYFIVAGHITALQRFTIVYKELRSKTF